MVLVVGGMIGLGKTTVTKILADEFKSKIFYEEVQNNKILPLFYNATEEEIKREKYAFLLQIDFLNKRFKNIKQALQNPNNILDRSIYEDWYFMTKNYELGRITKLEKEIYEELLENMLEEIEGLPKKTPDLFIYLKGSFDTVLKRIKKRGREYEIDDKLVDYYRLIHEGYDDWATKVYNKSKLITIDMDTMDVVNNLEDKQKLINLVKKSIDNNK